MPGSKRAGALGGDLARAARLLVVRSRREATGLFAGSYASAFRGGGLEFEESRPYAPGDDVRSIDWNATARRSEPFVKRFREERDQTVLFALDVSASMRFTSGECSKGATAAHALSLMAVAGARVGDRCGLVAFDEQPRVRVPTGRGASHTWRVIRAAVEAAEASTGGTRLAAGLRALRIQARRRAVVVVISDFRDPELPPAALREELASLGRRHDLVAALVVDPRELAIPRIGPVRIADPERPGHVRLLDTGSRRTVARYRAAALAAQRRLELELRRSGADVLRLRTDHSPLYALGRFFQERAARRARVAA